MDMVVRSRYFGLAYRTVAFTLLLVAFIYTFKTNYNSWEILLHFSILSAIFEIFILGIETLCNAYDLTRGNKGIPAGFYMPVRFLSTIYSVISLLGFLFVVLPYDYEFVSLPMGLLISGCAIFSILDWLLFCIKGTVRKHRSYLAIIFPFFYCAFIYCRVLIWKNVYFTNGGKYPYVILNQNYNLSIVYFLLFLVLTFLIAWFMAFLNQLIAGKFKKRIYLED